MCCQWLKLSLLKWFKLELSCLYSFDYESVDWVPLPQCFTSVKTKSESLYSTNSFFKTNQFILKIQIFDPLWSFPVSLWLVIWAKIIQQKVKNNCVNALVDYSKHSYYHNCKYICLKLFLEIACVHNFAKFIYNNLYIELNINEF